MKHILSTIEYLMISIVLYFIINIMIKNHIVLCPPFHSVFDELIHTVPYQSIHPIPFIFVTCISFLITQLLVCRIYFKHIFFNYLLFYMLWLLLSCVIGGGLWSYYDMEAGWYPQGLLLIKKILNDIKLGVLLGPGMVIMSIPYNLLILISSFLILRYNKIIT